MASHRPQQLNPISTQVDPRFEVCLIRVRRSAAIGFIVLYEKRRIYKER